MFQNKKFSIKKSFSEKQRFFPEANNKTSSKSDKLQDQPAKKEENFLILLIKSIGKNAENPLKT
jgi:hypothetical protein